MLKNLELIYILRSTVLKNLTRNAAEFLLAMLWHLVKEHSFPGLCGLHDTQRS